LVWLSLCDHQCAATSAALINHFFVAIDPFRCLFEFLFGLVVIVWSPVCCYQCSFVPKVLLFIIMLLSSLSCYKIFSYQQYREVPSMRAYSSVRLLEVKGYNLQTKEHWGTQMGHWAEWSAQHERLSLCFFLNVIDIFLNIRLEC